tara:strand:- start:34 stop:282 length:249 start_codon:yes stop_codon:yes gene_type:complete
MDITEINQYRDGGTFHLETCMGDIYVDGRMGSQTRGGVYVGNYPDEYGSLLVHDMKDEIEEALVQFRPASDADRVRSLLAKG